MGAGRWLACRASWPTRARGSTLILARPYFGLNPAKVLDRSKLILVQPAEPRTPGTKQDAAGNCRGGTRCVEDPLPTSRANWRKRGRHCRSHAARNRPPSVPFLTFPEMAGPHTFHYESRLTTQFSRRRCEVLFWYSARLAEPVARAAGGWESVAFGGWKRRVPLHPIPAEGLTSSFPVCGTEPSQRE
jgi:hypothetical protein